MSNRGMSDAARASYFLAALVAVFVLAWFAGSVLGPVLDVDRPGQQQPTDHEPDSSHPTGQS
jgi:hypothetical protein